MFSVNKAGARREGSCGKPIGEDYLIEAFDDDGNMLERGGSGELCISSPTGHEGYLLKRYGGYGKNFSLITTAKDGLKTGDLGFVDKDGFIFIQQRLKRIIKVSGVPVFPAEIERLVNTLKDVDECCAVGIEHTLKGKVIMLYVTVVRRATKLKKTVKEFAVRSLTNGPARKP